MSEKKDRLESVKVVEILPTKVWVEKDTWGTVQIKMQHQGEPEPFTFIEINYHYYYTSNSHQHHVAQEILKLLGYGEATKEQP